MIICTATIRLTPVYDISVNITWNKDKGGDILHNSSDITITSATMSEHTYQSNMTIHVLRTSNRGLYSCTASLVLRSTGQLISLSRSSIYLDVEGTLITTNTTHYTMLA